MYPIYSWSSHPASIAMGMIHGLMRWSVVCAVICNVGNLINPGTKLLQINAQSKHEGKINFRQMPRTRCTWQQPKSHLFGGAVNFFVYLCIQLTYYIYNHEQETTEKTDPRSVWRTRL